ncbi:MAG TPA: ribose-phosphate pyrophosphokinase, partial [Nevskiaceae bacterium]|nr:ribose-phosphate pyrophosphokinase [Nevskiaceae bacterium]
ARLPGGACAAGEHRVNPLIAALPGSTAFAAALRQHAALESLHIDLHRFPDGECLVRLDGELRGRDLLLVCSLNAPDDKLLPLLFAASTARDLGAQRVILVAPYLAYMRQDRRFHAGEAISSRPFAALLSAAFDGLVTVDPHLHRYRNLRELYSIPARAVAAAPDLAGWIVREAPSPLIVGPDEESAQWAQDVAARAAAPCIVLRKTRLGDREVSIDPPPPGMHAGRTPVLIDDIISTGRTLLQAARVLRAQGYAAPVCVGVHALCPAPAYEELRAGVARVVSCNTVEHASNAIDVAPAVWRAAQEMLGPD